MQEVGLKYIGAKLIIGQYEALLMLNEGFRPYIF